MSIYLLMFLCLIVVTFASGIFTFSRYKKSSGLFYLIFSIAIPLWFMLYFISFNSDLGADAIMRIYRFQYSLSIIGFYSILLFVYFFANTKKEIQKHQKTIYTFFGSVFLVSNLTPFIVQGVSYDTNLGSYVEVFGVLYNIFVFLYALIFPLFAYISFVKIRELSNLDRTRIIYIILGFFLFIAIALTFLVFIPFVFSDATLLLFENLTPFFILPFIISVLYSSYKYDFSDYKFYLSSLFIYGISIFFSFIWLLLTRTVLGIFNSGFMTFWGISNSPTWFDLFYGIVLFIIFFHIFKRFAVHDKASMKISNIQEQIPFITNLDSLNLFLRKKFKTSLYIQDIYISKKVGKYSAIKSLFEENQHIPYLINDFVFLEKYKHKINVEELEREITSSENIIFPLFSNLNEVTGLLFVGRKRFSDAYSSQEIKALKSFSNFLQGHLKYISVYKKIQDLSINLDKQVDEKTIEYNDLLNKQKEFIAYVGHEIKNPITNSIFLCDSLKDELKHLKEWDSKTSKRLSEDGNILYEELLKVSELVKSIFSAEQFDLNKVKLYKKSIDIGNFIHSEVRVFENSHPHIYFEVDIGELGNKEIDETQFRQVIHNLLTNATKFAFTDKPRIRFSAYTDSNDSIHITIEDNGNGFKEIDISNIFNKYSTGDGSAVGLGMGLYLCKKIVELHKGKITAGNGKELGGAQFTIIF